MTRNIDVAIQQAWEMQAEGRYSAAIEILVAQNSVTSDFVPAVKLAGTFNSLAEAYAKEAGPRAKDPEFNKKGAYPYMLNMVFDCCEKAWVLDKTNDRIALAASMAARTLGMYSAAFDYARASLEINPASLKGWEHLATMHREKGQIFRFNTCLRNAIAVRTGKAASVNMQVLGPNLYNPVAYTWPQSRCAYRLDY